MSGKTITAKEKAAAWIKRLDDVADERALDPSTMGTDMFAARWMTREHLEEAFIDAMSLIREIANG